MSAQECNEAAILISSSQQKPTGTRTDTAEKSSLVMATENIQQVFEWLADTKR